MDPNTQIAINNELARQVTMWGVQSHSLGYWLAILTEEVGEVAREVCHYNYERKSKLGLEDNETLFKLKQELVQVAAVAAAWIECLDRRG